MLHSEQHLPKVGCSNAFTEPLVVHDAIHELAAHTQLHHDVVETPVLKHFPQRHLWGWHTQEKYYSRFLCAGGGGKEGGRGKRTTLGWPVTRFINSVSSFMFSVSWLVEKVALERSFTAKLWMGGGGGRKGSPSLNRGKLASEWTGHPHFARGGEGDPIHLTKSSFPQQLSQGVALLSQCDVRAGRLALTLTRG